MIKKIILSLFLIILFGCSSTRLVPTAEIKRIHNSKFAIISVDYAGDIGVDIIIQNKLGKIVEILWDRSKINDEKIVLSGVPYKDLYKDMKNDLLIPNLTYKRVIFPLSSIGDRGNISKLPYPVKLEIFFRRGEKIDKSTIIIREGNIVERRVDFMGQVID